MDRAHIIMTNKKLFLPLVALFALTACKHTSTVKPQRKDIVDAVFASGHLENKLQYTLVANTEGYLKQALVAEGDSVKQGQQLFVLSNEVQQTQVSNALSNLQYAQHNAAATSPQIAQLKLQLAQAQQKLAVDSANYARYQRLIKTNAVARVDFDNVQLQYQSSVTNVHVLQKNLADLQHNLGNSVNNAEAQYRIQQQNNAYYFLTAKANSLVLSVLKKPGDYVKKGDVVAQCAAGSFYIKLYIAEDDIQRVTVGQQVLISLNSNKDKVFKASVTKIYPEFDANQQAFVAEAVFTENPGVLLNGTQLQGNIIVKQNKGALVIPTYTLNTNNEVQLYNHKERTPIKVGIRTLDYTDVLGGLTEDDEILTPKQN